MNEEIVVTLAGIGALAIACQWLAWWVKLPAILFLLLTGLVAGPITGWLNPNEVFGDLLFPMVSLSVAVILFEGSLTLKLPEIQEVRRVVLNLVTVGLLVTWLVTTIVTHFAVGFPWELAFLFGAVTAVTGPTVIIPMLRTVRPTAKIANVLRWEGIVIDPIGALLAVLVYEYIVSSASDTAVSHTLFTFGSMIVVGSVTGALGGLGLAEVLRRHLLPEYLQNIATLACVFVIFAISNHIESESGLLAVTVMGMWLANTKNVHVQDILDFKESLSVLLISVLFIVLAARVEFEQFQALGWSALLVLFGTQLIGRPLKVFVSTLRSNLSFNERIMLAWIGPRGIVAAAVSALFALRLQENGNEQAALIVPLTFLVIIGTVVIQGATARTLALWLGVAEPEPKGVLVVGANLVARTIAKALRDKGFDAVLTDASWDNIRAARMDGLRTYYGMAVSEHADRHLDLVGIGRMMAMTPHREFNALASLRYQSEFGKNAVYTLATAAEKSGSEKHTIPVQHRGYTLFSKDATYQKLASLVSQGAEIRTTTLTETFDFQAYKEKHGQKAITLFAVDPKGRLQVFVDGGKLHPGAGWTVTSVIPPEAETTAEKAEGSPG